MAKRLKNLKVREVSVVDRGAGEGVRVVLMKRKFGGADSLVRIGKIVGVRPHNFERRDPWRFTDDVDPIAKAKQEIAENLAVAKSLAVTKEDHDMQTQTVDVAKADAIAVIKRFDDTIATVAKAHNITRGAALLKIAADREMAADWFAYRNAQQMVGTHIQAAPEPEPVAVSDAYAKMAKKAAKLAKAENISEATAFGRVYQSRPDLAAQDKSWHIAKASGVDPDEQLIQAIMASLNCDRAHANGVMLELRSKRPPASTLTVRTRDAA